MRGLKVNKSAFVSHACMEVGGGARASSDMGRQWTSSRCKIESLFLLLLYYHHNQTLKAIVMMTYICLNGTPAKNSDQKGSKIHCQLSSFRTQTAAITTTSITAVGLYHPKYELDCVYVFVRKTSHWCTQHTDTMRRSRNNNSVLSL